MLHLFLKISLFKFLKSVEVIAYDEEKIFTQFSRFSAAFILIFHPFFSVLNLLKSLSQVQIILLITMPTQMYPGIQFLPLQTLLGNILRQ